jgi:predicted nucleic acid-binding protein
MLMDACLVDTNVLLRMPKRSDPHHAVVDQALSRLALHGETLYLHTPKYCRVSGTR